jgi:hypothetical protein
MQHDYHLAEENTGAMTRVIAIVVMLVGLCAIGAYVVYGSGMWNPPPAQSPY